MDIEFDFKGDPVGGVITNCTLSYPLARPYHISLLTSCNNRGV